MKQAKKNFYRFSMITLLVFSGQYTIATEETTSSNIRSVNENSEQISMSKPCSPMPQCARDNENYQPTETSNWFATIMEILQLNKDDSEHN